MAEQWGVMFRDGSVAHPWNGRTQQQRAREALAKYRAMFPRDAPHLSLAVRAEPDAPWQRVDDKAE